MQILLGLMKDFSKRQSLLSHALTALTTTFVKDGHARMQQEFTAEELYDWIADKCKIHLPKTSVLAQHDSDKLKNGCVLLADDSAGPAGGFDAYCKFSLLVVVRPRLSTA